MQSSKAQQGACLVLKQENNCQKSDIPLLWQILVFLLLVI